MIKIQANASGTRQIEVTEQHLQTLSHYALLDNLVPSNGIVNDDVLRKLQLQCRSLLESQSQPDHQLIALCLDVIYHPHMKPFALSHLLQSYAHWHHLHE